MSDSREIPLSAIPNLAPGSLPLPGSVDVTIEVISEDLGDQLEVTHLPWHGLTYDPDNEVLEISVGGRGRPVPVVLRHQIHAPTAVWLEERQGTVRAVSIEAADGSQTLVRFHMRPALAGE